MVNSDPVLQRILGELSEAEPDIDGIADELLSHALLVGQIECEAVTNGTIQFKACGDINGVVRMCPSNSKFRMLLARLSVLVNALQQSPHQSPYQTKGVVRYEKSLIMVTIENTADAQHLLLARVAKAESTLDS